MADLVGWLPLLSLAAVAALVGLRVRRRSPAARIALLISPAVLFGLAVLLVELSPPCPDLLDGPCEQNWVSEAAGIVVFVLFPLALGAAVTLAVASTTRYLRRRRRSCG